MLCLMYKNLWRYPLLLHTCLHPPSSTFQRLLVFCTGFVPATPLGREPRAIISSRSAIPPTAGPVHATFGIDAFANLSRELTTVESLGWLPLEGLLLEGDLEAG